MSWPVFWLTATERVRVTLRRYTHGTEYGKCPNNSGYGHNASSLILSDAPEAEWIQRDEDQTRRMTRSPEDFPDDPRWPRACTCGAIFPTNAIRQVNADALWQGAPDGKLYTIRDAPVGAMWDAHWMGNHWRGPDGIALVVKTPGGDWTVDGRASNCDKPDEWTHKCWTRSGDPRTGKVDVGKQYGPTCNAGAGSIMIGGWHGFLHNGVLHV